MKVMETVNIPEVNAIHAVTSTPEELEFGGHRIVMDEYDYVPNDDGLFICIRAKDGDDAIWLQANIEQLEGLRDTVQKLLDIQEKHGKPKPVHGGILP